MCGRFALHVSEAEIMAHFKLRSGLCMRPRYNLAPAEMIPVIKMQTAQVDFCRWGYVPAWFKNETSDALPQGQINARAESLFEKPFFKTALKSHRCLIPASGYFEWRTFGQKKQPFYFYLKNAPLFAFAGIWSTWQMPNGMSLATCAVITTEAPTTLAPVHARIPLILNENHYEQWLSPRASPQQLTALLKQPAPTISVHAVTVRMNNPRFESEICILPL